MAQGTTKGVPIDTDPLLANNSDLLVPSQKAIKTYVDNSNANQVTSVTGTSPIVSTGGTTPVISIPTATGSTDGYLSSTDFTTFNNKQNALSGTGFVKISGTTISYDNSTYLTTNQSITLSGDVTGTGTTAITTTIGNNAVTNAKFRQSSGLSVVGRSATTTGNVADITGSTALSVFRVNSGATGLEFAQIFNPIVFYLAQGVSTGSTTSYYLLNGNTTGVTSANKASRQMQFMAGLWKNFYIRTSSTQPSTGSLVMALHINNTTSSISITIAANSAAGFFSDTTNTATTAAGNYVCWEMVNNATTASASVLAGNIGFMGI